MRTLADFLDDVAQEVWDLALGYWFNAFTKWLNTLLNSIFGVE